MATTGGYAGDFDPAEAARAAARRESDYGWTTFAACMLGFAGVFAIIDGVVALTRSRFFVGNAVFVFSDLRTWGWIVLLLGIASLFAAAGLLSGSEVARWFGITVAGLNAIGQLLFVQAYPWWSVAVFALDVLVVYALVAHAGKRLRDEA